MEALSLIEVQKLALLAGGLHIVDFNEELRAISFADESEQLVITVYYFSGTVSTKCVHPLRDAPSAVLFHSDVSMEELASLFHASSRKRQQGSPQNARIAAALAATADSSLSRAEEEEVALRRNMRDLKKQYEQCNSMLQLLEEKREKEKEFYKQERLRNVQLEAEEQKKAMKRAANEAVSQREEMRLARRGTVSDWAMLFSDNFPEDMTTIKALALSQGGYLAIDDSGDCVYDGIDSEISTFIDKYRGQGFHYCSVGPLGQFFVERSDGKRHYGNISWDFKKAINSNPSSLVQLLAFGVAEEAEVFYLRFADGLCLCSGLDAYPGLLDIVHGSPNDGHEDDEEEEEEEGKGIEGEEEGEEQKRKKKGSERKQSSSGEPSPKTNEIDFLWLGEQGKYFVAYNVCFSKCSGITDEEVMRYCSHRNYDVRQVMLDELHDTFFVRFN